MFFPAEPVTAHNLASLHEEIRAAGENVSAEASSETAQQIRSLARRLDHVTAELRRTDRGVSPSFVRRFFERVRPQDEKTALHLLRFYFSQADTDVDVIDKINFLATVAAAGSSDPGSSAARPESELSRLFELVTSATVWRRPSDREAVAIAYVVNQVAARVANAQTFEELMSRGLIDEFREVKRKTGESLAHAKVLSAVACGNLITRAAFSRLYRSEEKVLAQATNRIEDIERELRLGPEDGLLPDELRRFRETRDRLRRGALDSNVRAADIVHFKAAIGQVLEKFDRRVPEDAEGPEDAHEPRDETASKAAADDFWRSFVARILAVVEIEDAGRGSLQPGSDGLTELALESWELNAARRVVSAGGESRNDRDRTLLRAVALRLKAEEEANLLRTISDGPSSLELLRQARASIAHAPELDANIAQIVRIAHEGGLREHVRAWTRTRFRLLRAISELWLTQDKPGSGRTSR